jgi:hypothetical protein
MTLVGTPAAIFPTNSQQILVMIVDSGTFSYGVASLNTAGLFTCFKTPAGGAFTNTGAKGINSLAMSYPLT